jgi:hypothetical protein
MLEVVKMCRVVLRLFEEPIGWEGRRGALLGVVKELRKKLYPSKSITLKSLPL